MSEPLQKILPVQYDRGARRLTGCRGVDDFSGAALTFMSGVRGETGENTNPDKYPVVFRLKAADLPHIDVALSIPPFR